MTDVFFSYKREDRAKVEKLVRCIEAAGYTVWWDPQIKAGERYADVIGRSLEDAKCVVIGWSELSTKSDFVRDEAENARARSKLLPVSLDGTLPPLGFQQIQTVDLKSWDATAPGAAHDPRIEAIITGIRRLAGDRTPAAAGAQVNHDVASATQVARIKAEQEYWTAIRDSRNASDFASFLEHYPEGQFTGAARARLAQLNAAPAKKAASKLPLAAALAGAGAFYFTSDRGAPAATTAAVQAPSPAAKAPPVAPLLELDGMALNTLTTLAIRTARDEELRLADIAAAKSKTEAEAEAKRKADSEAEAKRQAEAAADAKRKQEADAKRRADAEEADRKAKTEARRAAEEAAKRADEEEAQKKRQPNALSYSMNVWGAGTIKPGQTVSSKTEYGRLTCRGGNNIGGSDSNKTQRSCSWE
jgi:hypothetical protein